MDCYSINTHYQREIHQSKKLKKNISRLFEIQSQPFILSLRS